MIVSGLPVGLCVEVGMPLCYTPGGETERGDPMKAAVRKAGVLVPKRLLKGATTVEIRRERARVIVLPLHTRRDPIRKLGRRPVRCGLRHGAEDHDAYLYDTP